VTCVCVHLHRHTVLGRFLKNGPILSGFCGPGLNFECANVFFRSGSGSLSREEIRASFERLGKTLNESEVTPVDRRHTETCTYALRTCMHANMLPSTLNTRSARPLSVWRSLYLLLFLLLSEIVFGADSCPRTFALSFSLSNISWITS
jgi:hypothetical protein